jgi:hypothetical protein
MIRITFTPLYKSPAQSLDCSTPINVMYLTIPFAPNVRFVPLKMSDPPAILTSIKKVK